MPDRAKSSTSITAFGLFLFFGATAASLAGISLSWPGTFLDPIWKLNPTAYLAMAPLGKTIGIPFLFLAATLALTGILWFQRRIWGWRLAVVIIAIEVLGGISNAFRGDVLGGLIGFAIAAALLLFLLRSKTKSAFAPRSSTPTR